MTPEELARTFHESYERLAPSFGYKTRNESAKPWEEVPENNRKLMTAVCEEVMFPLFAEERSRALAEIGNALYSDKQLNGLVRARIAAILSRLQEMRK